MNKSIQTQFVLWLVPFIFFALLLMGLVIYFQQRNSYLQSIQESSLQITYAKRNGIEQYLKGIKNELNLLAEKNEVRSMDWDKANVVLNEFLAKRKETYLFLGITLPDGSYYSTIKGKGKGTLLHRSFNKDIFEKKLDYSIGDPEPSAATGQICFFFTVAVHNNNGDLVGSLSGVISVETISKFVSEVKIGKTGYGWLMDSQKTIISHPNKKVYTQTQCDSFRKIRL